MENTPPQQQLLLFYIVLFLFVPPKVSILSVTDLHFQISSIMTSGLLSFQMHILNWQGFCIPLHLQRDAITPQLSSKDQQPLANLSHHNLVPDLPCPQPSVLITRTIGYQKKTLLLDLMHFDVVVVHNWTARRRGQKKQVTFALTLVQHEYNISRGGGISFRAKPDLRQRHKRAQTKYVHFQHKEEQRIIYLKRNNCIAVRIV